MNRLLEIAGFVLDILSKVARPLALILGPFGLLVLLMVEGLKWARWALFSTIQYLDTQLATFDFTWLDMNSSIATAIFEGINTFLPLDYMFSVVIAFGNILITCTVMRIIKSFVPGW
ncbi:hypothetical protein [Rubellicoccus peritrichatus]|uniref:DUF2523 domain-containing protein n=1 Tax=Rubellicoccus peritrichatus TaxID=3080537 RepID=A0AAQ3L598_9BACT|nr:hypothetical protein [Puniceicoccus sp. CR14]WOO39659.1 hypothetical protein RZN69_13630 [Puniceicoccus sp. CR14]